MSDPTDGPAGPEGPGSPEPPDDAAAGDTPPEPSDDAGAAGDTPSEPSDDAGTAGDTPPSDPAPAVTPPPPAGVAADEAAVTAEATTWPSGAKVWVGVLAVIALLAGIAAIVGFSQASSNDSDRATVEEERDAAINRAQNAEQERDELAGAVADSEAEVETLTSDLANTAAQVEEAQNENEILAATVETERARADEAEAELAAIGEIFPITVDTSLVGLDLAGNYTISFQEKYCDFVTGCGTTPNANQAIIGVTPENFLDITIPGILQGGLFAVNGGLYAITDSETAIPPCGDVPRRGRVTITIWPSSIEVAEDGTPFPTALEASITLDAPTINECPSGLVFWGAILTPTG